MDDQVDKAQRFTPVFYALKDNAFDFSTGKWYREHVAQLALDDHDPTRMEMLAQADTQVLTVYELIAFRLRVTWCARVCDLFLKIVNI